MRGERKITRWTLIVVCTGALIALPTASAQDPQVKAFQQWAVQYAIGQQQASAFKLDDKEQMTWPELRATIKDPWEEHWRKLRDYVDTIEDSDERTRVYEEAMQDRDDRMMELFTRYFDAGRHSEAYLYFSMMGSKYGNLPVAQAAAFDRYRRGYEQVKAYMQWFKDEVATGAELDCVPYGGGEAQRLELTVLAGPRVQTPEHVAKLYAAPESNYDWPYFPTLNMSLGLSDGSEGEWSSFMISDVRAYDRTTGDQIRISLEWMTGEWLVYSKIIEEKGMEAAQQAFRDNFTVEVDENSVMLRDEGTHNSVNIQRTDIGTVVAWRRWRFLDRCEFVRVRKGLQDRNPLLDAPLKLERPTSNKG
ncbi:MAG: hypothetical protein RIC55_18230 [Pirellulaceae bacterium]